MNAFNLDGFSTMLLIIAAMVIIGWAMLGATIVAAVVWHTIRFWKHLFEWVVGKRTL